MLRRITEHVQSVQTMVKGAKGSLTQYLNKHKTCAIFSIQHPTYTAASDAAAAAADGTSGHNCTKCDLRLRSSRSSIISWAAAQRCNQQPNGPKALAGLDRAPGPSHLEVLLHAYALCRAWPACWPPASAGVRAKYSPDSQKKWLFEW